MDNANVEDVKSVIYETYGSVALITMNRPKSLNSMSLDLVEGVCAGIQKAEEASDIRIIILTGAGRAFSAGGDLPSLDKLHNVGERRAFIRKVGSMVTDIYNAKKPVIAMVNGVAAGAGFNLALACDLIYVADNAKFIQSFVNVGLSPDCGGFYYLAKAVGLAKAKELMFTAKPVSASEALDLGMINGVVSSDELRSKVFAVAENIASKAPLAIVKTKEAVNNYSASLDQTLEFEALSSAELLGTDDFKEGIVAFKEKRVPVFKGE